MTEEDVRTLLRQEIDKAGGQRAFAKKKNLSAPYVNDVLHQHRRPGPSILRALGLQVEINYMKKE